MCGRGSADNGFGEPAPQQDFQNYSSPAVDVNAPPMENVASSAITSRRRICEGSAEPTCLARHLQPKIRLEVRQTNKTFRTTALLQST